jgi:5-methylcytosine-specific restriction endonuclease McrA
MSRALVLNTTYEPLCVVSARRAVVLLLSQKADVVSDTDLAMHSERLAVNVPSIIKLRSFVRVPYRRRAALNRRAVFARDGSRCQYCAAPAESIDHVMPRSKGGEHVWENVVAACGRCNNRKAHHTLTELNWHLRSQPYAPKGTAWVIIAIGRVEPSWQPFLVTDPRHVAVPA